MIKDILIETEEKMIKSLETFKTDYSKISLSKANISLLSDIKVKYYGENYTIEQISVINIENSNSIIIKPFDKKNVPFISKAIINLKQDLNPFIDGDTIKVMFPKMTLERREFLARKVKNLSDNTKTAIRNIRKNSIQKIKVFLKENKMSQDDEKKLLLQINKLASSYTKKIEEMNNKKTAEILNI